MTTHLTKPIDETALYRTLSDVLTISTGAPAPPMEAQELIDLSSALRRLGNRPERVERLLRGFLRDFADAPARMKEHLRQDDAPGIAALAHLVKGAASYLEAQEFCESAEKLERAARQKDSVAVKAHAPVFQSHLTRLLTQIDASITCLPPQVAAEPLNSAVVLDLIDRLEPLLARGEYSAQPLLEKLSAALVGTSAQELADEVRSQFDELELTAASTALLRLKEMLSLKARAAGA
jgi:HPt (histidine-containing phosphotransfer) domain-containing protein